MHSKLARQSPLTQVGGGKSGLHRAGWRLTAVRREARNRATETSKSRFAVMDVKRGNLHLQQDQIGWYWRGSRRQRVGCSSAWVIMRLDEWLLRAAMRDKTRLIGQLQLLIFNFGHYKPFYNKLTIARHSGEGRNPDRLCEYIKMCMYY